MKALDPLRSTRCLLVSVGLATMLSCGPSAPTLPEVPCKGVAPGDVVLSEFMADPTGSDTGKQYIEVYNTTDHTVDLRGLALFQSMSDGSRLNATAMPSLAVSSHGYFVLGDAGDDKLTRPVYLNYGYGSTLGTLRHENGRLGLNCGSTVITETAYTEVSAGHARQVDGSNAPSSASVSDATQWCDATGPLNALGTLGENYGSPGMPNHPCSLGQQDFADTGLGGSHLAGTGGSSAIVETDAGFTRGGCVDPVSGLRRALDKPRPGDLVITEVMPAPGINDNGPGEWFEVLATRAVDLNQVELANEGLASTVLSSETCLGVQAGSWLLFARSSDPEQNGGLPSVTAVFDFTLANSGSSASPERSVSVRLEGNVIDRARWLKTTKGTSLQRSLSSLDSGAIAEWCLAANEPGFGAGDHGTPGATNTNCTDTLVDAGGSSNLEANTGTGGTATQSGTGTSLTVEPMDASGGATHAAAGGTSRAAGAGGASYSLGTGGASSSFGAGGTTRTSGAGGASNGPGVGGTIGQLTDAGVGGVQSTVESGGTSSVPAGAGGAPLIVDASPGNLCREADGTVREPIAPRVGDLVVTELMAAPSANNNGGAEWFELRVASDFDLNGLEITNESSGSVSLRSDSCLRVQAGERIVFARSAETAENGGLPFVSVTFAFTLADSASSAHPERALVLRYGDVELDRVTWTKSTKGASWQRAESALDTADAGDANADGGQLALWCVTPALATFGLGDRGTPGAANQACD